MIKMILNLEYPSFFIADFGDGNETELCESGSQIVVTEFNRDLFAKLYLEKYLGQDEAVHQAIFYGIREIAKKSMIGLLTINSAQLIAFSEPTINPDVLVSQVYTDYEGRYCEEDDETVKKFKQMIHNFSNKER